MPRWVVFSSLAVLATVPPALSVATADPQYLTAVLLAPIIWIGRRR